MSGIPFRIDDSPGHQNAAPRGAAADQQPSKLPHMQLLAELRRASAMALSRCVVSRHATAWAESLEGTMRGRQSPCRNSEWCRQELGVEATASLVADGANQRSDLQGLGSAKFWTAAQHSKEGAVTDRRTAREMSLRLGSPRIHQPKP